MRPLQVDGVNEKVPIPIEDEMVLFPRCNIKTGTGKKVTSRGYFVNKKKSNVKRIFRKKEKKTAFN